MKTIMKRETIRTLTTHYIDGAFVESHGREVMDTGTRAPKLQRDSCCRNLRAYLSGGFGIWELIYSLLATPVVYAGLRSYRFIGIAWLMHAA